MWPVRLTLYGCGCSSGVEHNLAKVGVEGSNPFARSKDNKHLRNHAGEWRGLSGAPPGEPLRLSTRRAKPKSAGHLFVCGGACRASARRRLVPRRQHMEPPQGCRDLVHRSRLASRRKDPVTLRAPSSTISTERLTAPTSRTKYKPA